MTDVHVATHPSGHPNKTAVNPENPIFGRPADPVVTEVSVEQAAIVQSDKAGRETVVSPLINEDLSPAPVVEPELTGLPTEADLDAVAAEQSLTASQPSPATVDGPIPAAQVPADAVEQVNVADATLEAAPPTSAEV